MAQRTNRRPRRIHFTDSYQHTTRSLPAATHTTCSDSTSHSIGHRLRQTRKTSARTKSYLPNGSTWTKTHYSSAGYDAKPTYNDCRTGLRATLIKGNLNSPIRELDHAISILTLGLMLPARFVQRSGSHARSTAPHTMTETLQTGGLPDSGSSQY